MMSMMNRFVALPRPLQAGLMLAAGGSVIGVLYMLLHGRALFVFLIGMAVVAAMLVVYRSMTKRARKRKAAKMEQGMAEQATTASVAGAPAERARIDDMRRNFEEGVAKFRAVGKNLYELPWYVIVGESGSGKTEAIRHCNIGFPPGLQDRLQGAGGTINMNWWFTDNAVLLDTAGRLMFEDTATGEWRQFLKLLNTHRHNCPINGMLLVIPADSLIKDTAEEIERKGSLIAQQLDQIQRELGVRFPVFVTVTKCDLVTGFREFFDGLHDPELQHQMLGWSNPESLDTPFNPSLLDEHMETVMNRLQRRRLRLLMEQVHTEDADASRADQVDSLYAFPASLSRLMPRLKRYLEMVFVAGAWSAKPLFLRGIYFASSMRDGSTLDEDLAEMVGMPVDSLPDGHVWAKERAYFLRDVFTGKVFRERGLVTRAVNAGRLRRVRRALVLGSGFLATLTVLLLTWLGVHMLNNSIGAYRDFWVDAAEVQWADEPLVRSEFDDSSDYEYQDDSPVVINHQEMELPGFYKALHAKATEPIEIPWIFRFAARFGDDIDDARIEAYRAIVTDSVLRPTTDAVRHKMLIEKNQPWSLTASQSLTELLRLEANLGGVGGEQAPRLDPMLQYVLKNSEEYDRYVDFSRETLTASIDYLFTSTAGNKADRGWGWVSPSLGAGRRGSHDAVNAGVERFIGHWSALADEAVGVDGTLLTLIKDLFPKIAADMAAYEKAERRLLRMPDELFATGAGEAPLTVADLTVAVDEWDGDRFKALTEAVEALETRSAAIHAEMQTLKSELPAEISPATSTAPAENWIGRSYRQASSMLTERKQKTFDDLLIVVGSEAGHSESQQRFLADVRDKIEKAKEDLEADIVRPDLESQLKAFGDTCFTQVPVTESLRDVPGQLGGPWDESLAGSPSWSAFQVRYLMYALGDQEMARTDGLPDPGDLPAALEVLDEQIGQARTAADDLWAAHAKVSPVAEDSYLNGVDDLATFTLRCAKRGRVRQMLADVLADKAGVEKIKAYVKLAAAKERDLSATSLPMTMLDSESAPPAEPQYHPEAAPKVLQGWRIIGQFVAPDSDVIGREQLAVSFGLWEATCEDYVAEYHGYWTEGVGSLLEVTSPNWADFQGRLQNVYVKFNYSVSRSMGTLAEQVADAVEAVAFYADDEERKRMDSTVKRLRDAADRVASSGWRDDTRRVLKRWRDLGPDPIEARQELLRLDVGDFLADYMPFVAVKDDPVVKRYLLGLVLTGLEMLADESQTVAEQAWRDFRRDSVAFPLVRDADTSQRLTAEQMAKIPGLLRQVGGASEASSTQRRRTLAGGATTGYSRIDEQLEKLRGLQWGETGEDLVLRLHQVARALTVEGAKATIAVAAREDQHTSSFFSYYGGGVLICRDKHEPGARVRGLKTSSQKLGELKYGAEAGAFEIRVYRQPGDPDDQPAHTIRLGDLWGPIELLQGGQVVDGDVTYAWTPAQRDRDKKTWRVELTVAANASDASKRSMVLEMKFVDELPQLSDWPTKADFENAAAEIRR